MALISKSNEELIELAKEFGYELKFNSENAGVTRIDSEGNTVSHESWDDIWEKMKKHLGYE